MNLPMLELVGVEKRFGFHQVLRNIELKLNYGEFILLLGNNGAGKSTLLKIICLLMKPTAGKILHRGEPLQEQSRSWLKLIGSLTHESRLYRDLTAQENLMVYGTLYDLPNLSQRIEHALEETGLTHAAKLPVHTFSSGMNKRLRIGRLIMLGCASSKRTRRRRSCSCSSPGGLGSWTGWPGRTRSPAWRTGVR